MYRVQRVNIKFFMLFLLIFLYISAAVFTTKDFKTAAAAEGITITVQSGYSGGECSVIMPTTGTVEELKTAINTATGIQTALQNLLFNNNYLVNDYNTLSFYGITEDCAIRLMVGNWYNYRDISWWSSTASTTFYIDTPEKLAGVAYQNNTGADSFTGDTIIVSNDIDLSARLWTPIGNISNVMFQGSFDGNKYAIAGLFDYSPTALIRGLFGFTQNATIEDVNIISGNLTFYGGGGAVVGRAESSTLRGCTNNAVVISAEHAGGIAGNITNGIITDCANFGTVSGRIQIGGVSGQAVASVVINSINNSAITGSESDIGGIVGYTLTNSDIENCYNTGAITTSTYYAGGICGRLESSDIRNCYSTGNVTGSSNLGGVAGYFYNAATANEIKNCYYLKTDSVNAAKYAVGLYYSGSFVTVTSDNDNSTAKIYSVRAFDTYAALASTVTAGAYTGTVLLDTLNGWVASQAEPNDYLNWKVEDGVNSGYPTFEARTQDKEVSVTVFYDGVNTFLDATVDLYGGELTYTLTYVGGVYIGTAKAGDYNLFINGVVACAVTVTDGLNEFSVYLYSLTYNANGAISGSVPEETCYYPEGMTVDVAGNTGSLAKTGYTFAGFGTSVTATPLASVTVGTSAITLYAIFNLDAPLVSLTDGSSPITYGAALSVTFTHPLKGEPAMEVSYIWKIDGATVSATDTYMPQSAAAPYSISCTVTFIFGADSSEATAESTYTINKKMLIDDTVDASFVYDGNAHYLTVAASGFAEGEDISLATVTYSLDNATYTSLPIGAKTVADSNLIYYRAEFDNYVAVAGRKAITITRATLEDATQNVTKEYDNTIYFVTVSCSNFVSDDNIGQALISFSMDDVNYSLSNYGRRNAGSHTVYYRVMLNNYNTLEGSKTLTITKAALQDITAPATSATYDGAAHYISLTLTGFKGSENISHATVTYSADGINFATDNIGIIDVADSKAIYYKAEFENYNTIEGSAVVTIEPIVVSIAWKTSNNPLGAKYAEAYVYSAVVQGVYPFVTNALSGEEVTLASISNEYIFAADTEYRASVTYIDGADGGNYTLAGAQDINIGWAIGRATLTAKFYLDGGENFSLVYDGAPHTITADAIGVQGADTVTLTLSGSVNETAAGSYTANAMLDEANTNYTMMESNVSFAINKAVLQDQTANVTAVYDGNEHFITVALDGFAHSETIALGSLRYAAVFGEFGTDEIGLGTAGVLRVYYEAAFANYETVNGSRTITITPKAINAVILDETTVYGEALRSLRYTVDNGEIINGDDLGITLTKALGLAVGDYTISGSAENANYNVMFEEGTYTITKKALSDATENVSIIYDGAAHYIVITPEGFVYGDDVTCSTVIYSLDNSNFVGDNIGQKDVGTITVYYEAGFDNYINFAGNRTVTVEKRDATVYITDKVSLEGAPLAPLTYTSRNAVSGDDLNVILTKAEGTTPGKYAITGTCGNGNYNIEIQPGLYTVRIAGYTVPVNNDNQLRVAEVTSPIGFEPGYRIIVNSVFEDAFWQYKQSEGYADAKVAADGYDVLYVDAQGNEKALEDFTTVRIKLKNPNVRQDRLSVLKLNGDGTVIGIDCSVDGDYLVFETNKVGRFAVITAIDSPSFSSTAKITLLVVLIMLILSGIFISIAVIKRN